MYLLDTDIIIYALKGHPGVKSSLEKHALSPMVMSVISLMELYYGAHRRLEARELVCCVKEACIRAGNRCRYQSVRTC
ncbi:MAG: PIN domain-containing protein [Candidatus Methylomirabilia bacterium]